MTRRLTPWLLATRPKTLPAAVAPVLIGCACAIREGCFSLLPATAIFAAAILIQIATNFANDVVDFERGTDTDSRLGPVRAVQSGLISAREMRFATAAVLALALLVGIYLVSLGGMPILLIGLSALALALLYSATSWALSYNGFAEIFVLLYFGPIATCGTQYILCGSISGAGFLGGVASGALSTAILAVNNLRDLPTDTLANKRTLAVRYGERFARREVSLLLLLPGLIVGSLLIFSVEYRAVVFSLFYLAPALVQLRLIGSKVAGKELNTVLAGCGKTLLVFAALFSLGLIS